VTLITPDYVRTMAAYNAEMNRRLYAAADRLTDAERKEDRGAFWQSLHGTLCHILWGDRQWMSRFDAWPKNAVPIKQSAGMIEDFSALKAERVKADDAITTWANKLDQAELNRDFTWYSGASQREMTRPYGVLIMHFFNHQTHHRGQAHGLLTPHGIDPGATDLPWVLTMWKD
jgi:uncharacterized damage-inducible protein DinB